MATKALFFLITSGAVTGELFNEAFDAKLSGNVYPLEAKSGLTGPACRR